jgi:DNA-binding SARP family transcriptional activator
VVQGLGSSLGSVGELAHEAPTLRVACFGHFRIAGPSGWERGPEQKRAREVMQYLSLHPTSIAARERLTESLWPGETSDSVLHRLHAAVSGARTFLRRLLDGFDAIRCSDEGYFWHPEMRVVTDVVAFSELYRDGSASAARDAVALYGGELLAGQEADWLRPARVKYACMYASMVERLANDAFNAEAFEPALHFGLELLELDRAHEGASRLVLRCFEALGRRSQAQREYASLRAYLHKHLGIEPMPETTELIRTIMRQPN